MNGRYLDGRISVILLGINHHALISQGDPNLLTRTLIHDTCYLGLENLVPVEFDPHADREQLSVC
jgi:hypothetical protein